MSQAGKADLGEKVLLVGLGLQLVFFLFFLTIAIIFNNRMSSSPLRYTIPTYGKHSWKKLFVLLIAAALLIIGRCLFKMAEFAMGSDGYLLLHEWTMYAGDAVPMFVVQAMFHVVHAGDVFPKKGSDMAMNMKEGSGEYIGLTDRV